MPLSVFFLSAVGAPTYLPPLSKETKLNTKRMVRLYIIRHGDPYYEAPGGGSLTEHGKAEATALASFLESEGITHAYTSPLGRAKLTGMLGLSKIPKFSTEEIGDDSEEEKDKQSTDAKNNFEKNVVVEDWLIELSLWRCKDDYDCQHASKTRSAVKKPPAIWDFPAPIAHSQFNTINQGLESSPGWKRQCPDHGAYAESYKEFCDKIDELLTRHGIIRVAPEESGMNESHYFLSKNIIDDSENRLAKIAIFCHNGTGLTILSHLLRIPLPMVYASMWLAPSSVSTIVFDEYPAREMETYLASKSGVTARSDLNLSNVIVAPKAICIGGTNHLAMAGLSIPNSKYEDHERPSGIKHNFF